MDGRSRQDELREHALNMLASAVAYFDEVGFDPDTWQGSNLAQAFSEMTRGCYGLAAKSVGEAMLPATAPHRPACTGALVWRAIARQQFDDWIVGSGGLVHLAIFNRVPIGAVVLP